MKRLEMRVGLVAFSKAGGERALQLKELAKKALQAEGGNSAKTHRAEAFFAGLEQATVYVPQRLIEEFNQVHGYEQSEKLMGELFHVCHVILCFGATGIVVRSIAPHLQSKYRDPAVLVCDEKAEYVISLLSGHIGGANDYARQIGELLQAKPVITTASDTAGKFAVDAWAEEMHLRIEEPYLVKEITGKLLEGEQIGFCSDIPVDGMLPEGLVAKEARSWGICVSDDADQQPYAHTLHLRPRKLVVGVGCKKGTSEEALEEAWQQLCAEFQLDDTLIGTVASIDLKLREPGLADWILHKKAEGLFYTTEELNMARGDFMPSEFVEQVTGVDNVCQRAAALAGGEKAHCLVPKQKCRGITLAVYERAMWQITF